MSEKKVFVKVFPFSYFLNESMIKIPCLVRANYIIGDCVGEAREEGENHTVQWESQERLGNGLWPPQKRMREP